MVIRKLEIDIVRRENNILVNGLRENNSTIIPDSPIEYEYLRNDNYHQSSRFLPTGFK